MTTDPIRAYERRFAEMRQAHDARAFWMGRVGLYVVLKALGVGENDRVGLCGFGCLGTVEALTRLRARPVFLDVDRHLNINAKSLGTLEIPLKVLVIQHTFGMPADLDALAAWATRHGAIVVEDCCHAFGSRWSGKPVGSFGVAAIYSTQWGKSFSTGQGGMLTVQDPDLLGEVDRIIADEAVHPSAKEAASLAAQRVAFRWLVTPTTRRALRGIYGFLCDRGILSGSEPTSDDLFGPAPGFVRRLSPSQARVGLKQLARWPEIEEVRRQAARIAHDRLRAVGIGVETTDDRADPVHLRIPIWTAKKPDILSAAERARIDIAGWYCSPAHPLAGAALGPLNYETGDCLVAETAFEQVVTLPTRPPLTGRQLDAALQILQDPTQSAVK